MMHQIQFFLKTQLKQKRAQRHAKNQGFTLIELLVALILAVLVIAPILGLMVSTLDTDRKEQAKARSEQEVQAALDYIAQDLQQAIYIYDAKGVKAIKDRLPANAGEPVLVFWKRSINKGAIPAPSAPGFGPNPTNDAFVYSLVAYNLVKNTPGPTNIWSNTARIERMELNDGIRDPNNPTQYLAGLQNQPDTGFQLFDINRSGTLEDKMNAWKDPTNPNNTPRPTKAAVTLVDYIDDTLPSADPSLAPVDCTTVFPVSANTPPAQVASVRDARQLPAFTGTHAYTTNANANLNTGSFYACVDPSQNSAKVFIRGNAYARIETDTNKDDYNPQRAIYYPRASIQVEGKGAIGQ